MRMNEQEEGSSSSRYKEEGFKNPCPICLAAIPQAHEAYLDTCFHRFCYNCITRWAKYVAGHHSKPQYVLKCPLCKRDNVSILYECEGDYFRQHYINKEPEESFFSKDHKFRLRCYYREPGAAYDKFDVQRFWKLRKYLQPNKWLQVWLKREIQALTQEQDVDIVVHHIIGLIESFARKTGSETSKKTVEQVRKDFKAMIREAARPFLVARTDRFMNEVELFLASGLNIEAYDKVYSQWLETVSSTTGKEDKEVKLCEENIRYPYLHFFGDDPDTE